ncbi:thiamine pyrophosphate-dependent enzyme, partial [Flavobacteriales bacterium]|nr:thiamine pyrophosphate-dependent enzyme [Flavobacteriales bacterium]
MANKFSFLGAIHTNMIEIMYDQYIENPESVNEEWRNFFTGFDFAKEVYSEEDEVSETFKKEFQVINLIDAYRKSGHLFTYTNPVRERRKYSPTLDIENFGLEESDMETVFQAGSQVGIGPSSLKDIITHLKQVYCQSIGVEYMYIRKPDQVEWIKNRLHKNSNTPTFSPQEKKQILRKLNQAVAFENFMHTKFVGQKRFSLEGAEALIPALDALIEKGADIGVEEFVMGMAHRGRLNVLANIFNKTYRDIFSEFEGKEYEDRLFAGDVKYHLGYTSEQACNNGKKVKMSLSPNPSHLEAVDPVVQGIARAKIDQNHNGDNSKIVPILIHGDAALAGQGVVYEVIQMAQLDGYKTGGTIHIVVNNQVGFTTNYLDARSSTYCTDVGKVTLSPVFHVNGDDVEAVVHAMEIAVEYRQKFHKDVFIDLLCYRKYGHNEGDEPRFTQP